MESAHSDSAGSGANPQDLCWWCNTSASQSASVHEGPHATWCPLYSRADMPLHKPAPIPECPDFLERKP